MAIWLIRAGSHGEYEQKFITENRVYVTWERLGVDIGKLPDRDALIQEMFKLYTDAKPKQLMNWASQVWPFAHEIKKDDLVILPLKTQPAIQIGVVTGDYHFEPTGPAPFFHWRPVKWIGEAIPRSSFGQDLLYTFGAFLTICRVRRNNAEARIAAMRTSGWKADPGFAGSTGTEEATDDGTETPDLEQVGRDQIAQLINAKFKGHDLTRLIEGILQAQGYSTYRSPEGPDGGLDILAGAPPLGFGAPRLCVQVKSQDTPVDRPTVDQLLGAMTKVGAQEGIFVSWGGYKGNVQKELAPSFFKLRLWTQDEVLDNLFLHYNALDEDLKAELPLKRIWTVATQEEE